MALPNPLLISALRNTAENLSNGARYEWGHMGRCNCGHLVQTITQMTDKEIAQSIDHKLDEWTEHAKDYCTNSGNKVDALFDEMKNHGFYFNDMVNLEYLKDKKVLEKVSKENLRHNDPKDVALYMKTMADLLEDNL